MIQSSNITIQWCQRLRLGETFQEAATMKKCAERDFLLKLLESEVERRDALLIQKNIKNAKFPEIKTLDEFDFSDIKTPQSVARAYFTEIRFINDKYNLFFQGNPGTGKTHLAIALGVEASKEQKRVLFYRLPQLIKELREKRNEKKIR